MISGRRVIGLCMTEGFRQSHYNQMIALNNCITEAGFKMMIFHCCSPFYEINTTDRGEARLYEMIPYEQLDALIVCEELYSLRSIAHNIIDMAKQTGVPIIVIGKPHEGCISVSFDYIQGFENIVRHIIEYHHADKPYFINGLPGNSYSEERRDVVARVCADNGICFDDKTMMDYGAFWDMPAREATERMLAGDYKPNAVICANDAMALAVCGVLHDHGIKVPEDIIVSGFDGIDNIYYNNPQVSSACCSDEDMGREIIDILQDIFAGRKVEATRLVVPKLLPLESCGCHNAKEVNTSEMVNLYYNRLNRYMELDQSLFNLARQMQGVSSIEQLNLLIKSSKLTNFAVMLAPETLDESIESLNMIKNPVPETLTCIFENDGGDTLPPFVLKRTQLFQFCEKYLERDVPVVFNALYTGECLLGVIVQHTDWLSIDHYLLMNQLVITMRVGVMGYRLMAHQKLLSNRVIEMYKTDSLTGFFQRRAFSIEYKRIMGELNGTDTKLAVIMADLDNLKKINDRYGHPEGDRAIAVCADALRSGTPRGTVLFRYGGDEMVALVRLKEDSVSIEEINSSIKQYISNYNEVNKPPYPIRLSIGAVVEDECEGANVNKLLEIADRRMYKEKKQNKTGIQI